MKHLNLIGAMFCLLLSILDLILFPILSSFSDKAAGFYIILFIALFFAFLVLLRDYIEECEESAFWDGFHHCKKIFNK